ncbi:MAG: PAS domain S-box protein [Lachnospiraceae bacterium]|nr:PAS domain S-box protein [Lachnospiraceae bacterium]
MNMYEGLRSCSKRYCKLLLEVTDEIIIIFDIRGNVVNCNRAAIDKLGYKANDITGMYVGDIVSDLFSVNMYGNVVLPKMDESGRIMGVMYRSNMTCFDVYASIKSWTDEQGDFVGIVCATETVMLKSAEKQLNIAKEEQKKTEQIRTEFVANVTHELRTPLNGIIGHVKEIKEGIDSERLKTIGIIEKCADDMMKLINNILDFSKLEAGKYLLDEQECQFSKFIDHIVATHIKNIDEKGLKLVLNVDENIPEYILCDELALGRILNNLMSNAVKFTSVGNIMLQITKASETEDYVELFFMVIDSGIGISDEEKTKLFKEFSQVDASVTRKYGGTGLGLAITKQLVEMMNGQIFVESTKGEGSTFSFNVVLKKSEKTGKIDENNFTFSDSVSRTSGDTEDIDELFAVNKFGTSENFEEIRKNIDKLAITIEMNNFEKAEMFASNIKELVIGQDEELDKSLFRIVLMLRRENYEKSAELLGTVKSKLSEITGMML